MNWCKFLVVSRWIWDNSHIEYATFVIEGGQLDKTNFPAYLEKHNKEISLAVKNIVNAQDGSTMGRAEYRALCVVDSIDDLDLEVQINASYNRNYQPTAMPLTFNLCMLCRLNENGEPILT